MKIANLLKMIMKFKILHGFWQYISLLLLECVSFSPFRQNRRLHRLRGY